ncbi:aldo/keto reductase [Mycoplasmatota bacterium]|nr:aldo/keto reductase [Mycoplasmatota bacterium]
MVSNLPISKIGYGCYALSGAYGNQMSHSEKMTLINQAYDLGITYYDTASSYDDTESILGETLKSKRHNVTFASKVGMDGVKANLTKQGIIKSCENSLKNLKTDYIDIYQVHYNDPNTPISETIAGFEQLKKDGKIRYYGIGHLPIYETIEYLKNGNVSTILAEMSAISLFRYRELEPLLSNYDFRMVAFSVTGRGMLSGKITTDTKFDKDDIRSIDPLFKRNKLKFGINIANNLKLIGEKHHKTAVQMAIAWVLQKKGILTALIGPTKYEHLKENTEILNHQLSNKTMNDIEIMLEKEQKLLDKCLKDDVECILNQSMCTNYNQLYEDLVYVLEYCIENNELSSELGIKLFEKLLINKKVKNYSIKALESVKKEIQDNRIIKI